MSNIVNMVSNAGPFLIKLLVAMLVFSVIVIFHELGHFLLAKKNGIGVIEFSLGMGPRLISTVKGETRYSVKLLPFGGSCIMVGEDGDEQGENTFNNAPIWGRIAVVAAGPIFNFIMAFVFAMIIVSVVGYDPAEVMEVPQGSPAAEAGLKAGDVIFMDIDFSDPHFQEFVLTYPDKTELFFALRVKKHEIVIPAATVYFYAYELTDSWDLFWKY